MVRVLGKTRQLYFFLTDAPDDLSVEGPDSVAQGETVRLFLLEAFRTSNIEFDKVTFKGDSEVQKQCWLPSSHPSMDGLSSHFSVSLSFAGTQVSLLLTERARAVTVRQDPVVNVCRTFWQKNVDPCTEQAVNQKLL